MLITKDYLKSMNPCEDRYKHYLQNYKDWQIVLIAIFAWTKVF